MTSVNNSNELSIRLTAPTFTAQYDDIKSVLVPGVNGIFCVLPGHMNFVSLVESGVVKLKDADDVTTEYFIYKGSFHTDGQDCVIAADVISEMSKIDDLAISESGYDLQEAIAKAKESR